MSADGVERSDARAQTPPSPGTSSDSPAHVLLARAMAVLAHVEGPSRLDAEVLLAHVLQRSRTHLHAWPEAPVASDKARAYRALVARRAGGEPIAHLTGAREFWSLTLEITRDTLIPRPETERLVEVALEHIAPDADFAVADLGTGSGAVAAAIASERRACRVVATDISSAALAVAARNLERLALGNVALRHGDWCTALGGDRFAVIVSNPPYVARDDVHLARGDVRFEPREALVAGAGGLDAIRRIAAQARAHLEPGGVLALEHGYDQGSAVRAILARHGYRDVESYRDYAGHERVVTCVWDCPL
ncbi:MAG: peptide chain release factor N(5)-glutamine methyltransferase [Gammaproteobacteria bacterium]|nr:peptide chain release factor N(5)-glutamine methyltransferase [Gammaproteobacteria bacterium]